MGRAHFLRRTQYVARAEGVNKDVSATSTEATSSTLVTVATTEGEQDASLVSASTGQSKQLALCTVPVILCNAGKEIQVNALLDDASTRTYLSNQVASELGLQGEEKPVTVAVLNGAQKTFMSMPVELEVHSLDGKVNQSMTAYTTNARIVGELQATDWRQASQDWRHLKFLDFPELKNNQVDMLIGLDHLDLHSSSAEVTGRDGEPVARLTPLGWTCVGSIHPSDMHLPSVGGHNLYTFSTTHSDDKSLEELVRQFWEIDQGDNQESALSKEEKEALELVARSLQHSEGGYEVDLPWKVKPDSIQLPNSYDLALKRLRQTEKSLLKKPENAAAYSKTISSHLEKGYISKVPPQQVSQPGWYLPHFPIIRLDKATTKLRIVFDASARADGVALNDLLHIGPKLQRDLVSVLIRFRREPVALVCDIAEMYLQINLASQARPYHRFLWRDYHLTDTPEVYQFNRVVFGVNCSPFFAQYVSQEKCPAPPRPVPIRSDGC